MGDMKKDDVKAVLGRVLTWPVDEQEKVARFVREVEEPRGYDDIGEEEWERLVRRGAISRPIKRWNRCSVNIGRMKLRYDRGALADLDEIFAYIGCG
jgi:hypothetical protein